VPETKKLERCRGAHAEINSIINAQDTRRLRGGRMYTALFPCYDCMKALNNAGIKESVFLEEYKRIQKGGKKWKQKMKLGNWQKELKLKLENIEEKYT
jgi:dCMP deaminase